MSTTPSTPTASAGTPCPRHILRETHRASTVVCTRCGQSTTYEYDFGSEESEYDQVLIQKSELTALREGQLDLNRIALYLREHYRMEIERGYHSSRSLSDIIAGYLSIERSLKEKPQ